MTYAKSGLFWSQCFLPSLVIRKAQAGGGKSRLGLLLFGTQLKEHQKAVSTLDKGKSALAEHVLYVTPNMRLHGKTLK